VVGLLHEGEGAARQAMLAILVEADDLHRDVPRLRICLSWLSTVQPSMSGRKMSSEIGDRLVLARESSASLPRIATSTLKPVVAGEIDQDAGVVGSSSTISSTVRRADVVAVVGDMFGRFSARRPRGLGERHDVARTGHGLPASEARRHSQRQVEDEGAADARRAAQLDLAAQQVGQFAADRQAKAGAAILRLVEASACWKASKMIAAFPAGCRCRYR
jgi:hypothetical protein